MSLSLRLFFLLATASLAFGQAPVITSNNAAIGTVNTAFSYSITANTTNVNSYGAVSLPSSLTLNTGNGLIYGTPSLSDYSASPISLSVSATDKGLVITGGG